jgi:hypothetical protein
MRVRNPAATLPSRRARHEIQPKDLPKQPHGGLRRTVTARACHSMKDDDSAYAHVHVADRGRALATRGCRAAWERLFRQR